LLEDGDYAPLVQRLAPAPEGREPPGLRAESVRAERFEENEPPPTPDIEERGFSERESPSRSDFAGVHDLIAHVEERRPGETRFALLAGAGDGASRRIALELGRALAAKGRAVLVDLGPGPQNWLQDVVRFHGDRFVGLSDALAGAASFEAALHRDASSRLDILPAGESEAAVSEGLDEALVALAESYDFVIAHAADWREEAAEAGAELIKEMIIVAPSRDLPIAMGEARAHFGGSSAVFGCVAADRRARYERAA
jgi:hypothetical protein